MTDALENHEGFVSIGDRTITNLRFADDIDVLAGKEDELVKLINHLDTTSTKYGMEISAEKTKLMTNNTKGISLDVRIGGQKLETVQSFKYLGSVVTDKGSKQEIMSRNAQTTGALTKLKTIWKHRNIALSSKIRLMRFLVISIFLYACETWTLTAELEKKIQTTEMRCFQRLLGISYRDHVATDIFDWEGHQYLVTVDSYSGWFEMDSLSDMSSRTVIGKLQRMFATHGIPEKLLTDNGRQFVSREFKLFSQEWNFTHLTSSPYYPKSNGLAENAVKQVKQLLEKSKKDGSNFMLGLLNLRNTPRELMGSPAQRLMSRLTRTTLPTSTKLLKPKPLSTIHTQKRLQMARQRQKKYHDKTARDQRPPRPNEVVRLQTDKGFKKLAVVKSQRDTPRSYVVTSEGADYVRNRQHLVPVNELRPQWNTADHSSQDLVQAPVAVPLPQTLLHPTPQTVLHAPVAASPPLSSPQKPRPSAWGHPDPFLSPCLLPPSSVSAPSPSPSLVSSPVSMPARNLVQGQRQPVVTRSGRVSKPNPRYFDT